MPKCPKCKADIDPEDNFCPKCSYKIRSPTEQIEEEAKAKITGELKAKEEFETKKTNKWVIQKVIAAGMLILLLWIVNKFYRDAIPFVMIVLLIAGYLMYKRMFKK